MYNLGFPEIAIILVLVAVFVFEVIMFVHMLFNKRLSIVAKLIWGVAIFFIPLLASVYYYFTQYRAPKVEGAA